MIVLGCRLDRDTILSKIKAKSKMLEHLSIFETCIRPHLLELVLILQRILQLLEQLLHAWFVLGLPLDLTCLLLADRLVEHTRKVVLMDH